ncbi:monovalent cation/H+ antiporter subunit D family protein [Blastococcus sp. SYSU DS1024]
MSVLLGAPVVAPLAVAGLLVLLRGTSRTPARALAWGVSAGVAVVGALLLAGAVDGRLPVLRLGGWPPGIAITLVADVLSALLLLVTAVLVLAGLAFAAATGEDADPWFLPMTLVLSTGVYGALLTADLFNLFVFVEVMLLPSYVLLVAAGRGQRLAAGGVYVTVNLLASTVFLGGVALLYGITGTVNIGELAGAAAASTGAAAAGAVVLVALAAKSAVVPLHSWLPVSYSATGPAVTVLFSGLLTKVGVYALVRLWSVVFDGDPRYTWVLLLVAVATMAVGALGAIGEKAVRPILTFHMVSQIGYVLVGLALSTVAGLAAAVFFLVQYVFVKAALLVCAGAVEVGHGTGELGRLGGLARRDPLLAIAFAVSASALVGLPPLSGFVAKLGLASAAASEGRYVAVAAVAGVSLLTLVSMLKIWNGVFWEPGPGDGEEPGPAAVRTRVRPALVVPALLLVGPALVLGVWAEPLLAASTAAAEGLADTTAYVSAVSGR